MPTTAIPDMPLATVAALASVSKPTAWRWCKHGIHVGGVLIRLQARRVGTTWRTRRDWLDEFLAATDAAGGAEPVPIRTPAARKRAGEAAGRKLEALGL